MSYNPRDEYEDTEDEVTRCVCGSEEEVGDFMIQCEQCFVWQHGLCVGLVREEDSPEHYYCEKCRPENHAAVLRDRKYGHYYNNARSNARSHHSSSR
ncbi:Putative histone deacetylase complex subunit cti6 OS=Schizosaccharomyces pombe (strain 972 / ATCC 24843) GN=cti6 PE=1 SV=1 [Rhizoctonia solani AG-1 IB]|uniref:Putative histone deacetylase complex subunit cti6 n=1 Tax=Thanatephorus cucumeris (strain AG1-IB / isolate 7/3/14) TaxID=1108050 RepID=A0A0B7FSR8_THACB|nr:Putative histone deacetylase complex subunit cti6 OS=Schizosaccharomyces pombe (strain 972 / ATCC 24843) GN=cti6 PE=1 SV=1 [Rhizoctonia solani AG-1 IB]